MPIYEKYENLENYFHSLDRKIIINNKNYLLTDPREFKELLYTAYENEISLKPKCACGYYTGGWYLGKICPKCNTEVIEEINNIDPILWIRTLDPEYKWINPFFWGQLRNIIKKNVDCLRWLGDTSYNPPNIPSYMHTLASLLGGRGYHIVYNNIENIINFLTKNSIFKHNNKLESLNMLLEIYKKQKDNIFTEFIALPNKRLFVMEKTNKANYTISSLSDVIDIALYVMSIESKDLKRQRKLNAMANILSKITNLMENYIKEKFSGKKKLVRKHIYGSRSHFTIRSVITSAPSSTPYNVIYIPWSTLASAFRPHVLNKLLARGFTHKEANKIIFDHANKYSPLIHEIAKELENESPYKGIPVLLHRNPSQKQGSSQLVYARFKTDPADKSISVPITIIKAPNGDFDGDELNIIILGDNFMAEKARTFGPEYNIIDVDYFKVNKNLYLPPTTVVNITNYLNKPKEQDENCPVYKKILQLEKES